VFITVSEDKYLNATWLVSVRPAYEAFNAPLTSIQTLQYVVGADYFYRSLPSTPANVLFLRSPNPTSIFITLTNSEGSFYALRDEFPDTVTCLEVNLQFSVKGSVGRLNANRLDAQTIVKFMELQYLNGTTLDPRYKSDLVETVFIPGHYLKMSLSVCSFPTDVKFTGISVNLISPDNAAEPTTDYDLTLLPHSYVRFAYYREAGYLLSQQILSELGNLIVYDPTPPRILACPSNVSSPARPRSNSANIYWLAPTATDNQGVTIFNSTATPGTVFALGAHEVVYKAYDRYGNSDECSFFAIVFDNEQPSISCPPTQSFALNGTAIAMSAVKFPTATDNSGTVSLTIEPVIDERFLAVPGSSRLTAQATDPSGNFLSCQFTIDITDVAPPIFTGCPSDLIPLTALDSASGMVADWTLPTAVDNSDAAPKIVASHVPRVSVFDIGVTQVQYSATDGNGNVGYCRFKVTVTAPPSSSSGLSTNSQVGIGVGAGLFLILVIIIIIVLVVRNRRLYNRPHDFSAMLETLSDIATNYGPRQPREILRTKVNVLETLGTGYFGTVSKGTLSEIKGYPGFIVAVKTLHNPEESSRASLLMEAAIMAQFNNERIVGLIGVVSTGHPLLVVMEYCEHGELGLYLEDHDLTDRRKSMLAGDVAEGVAYLASLRFVHRDISARNVLLSSERRAKISDFGMSRETMHSQYYQSKGGQLPIRWTAPEALESMKFSLKSDIWSLGILVSCCACAFFLPVDLYHVFFGFIKHLSAIIVSHLPILNTHMV
jgi:serine/threonine protein kinase